MFRDRVDAGMKLAEILLEFKGKNCVVYALPRGGLPVAYQVARRLSLPLDILLVKKVGAPYQEELALGAVTEGDPPSIYFNRDLMFQIGYTEEGIQPLVKRKTEEIDRLKGFYREGDNIRLDPEIIPIIVDDGVATGATVKAAVKFFKEHGYRNVIVAVPVAHDAVLREIKSMADDIYCVDPVPYMYAVGEFYSDFSEISHEQAREILLNARHMVSDS